MYIYDSRFDSPIDDSPSQPGTRLILWSCLSKYFVGITVEDSRLVKLTVNPILAYTETVLKALTSVTRMVSIKFTGLGGNYS